MARLHAIVRASAMPTDCGRHHSRCPRCGCWLNRFHDPNLDGGLCYPCAPGGDGGVVIRVGPDEWRRFKLVTLRRYGKAEHPSEDEIRALMEAA